MEFVEIDVSLPEIIHELDELVPKLALRSGNTFHLIAGGSISNSYMNVPIRDIDIFLDFPISEDKINEIFHGKAEIELKKEFTNYGGVNEVPYLYRLNYKGYTVELISANRNRFFDFDLRFRYFFYKNGKVFAAKEALADIEEKKIVIVNPSTPSSTLFRAYRFSKELNFSIDEKSFSFLKWYANTCELKRERFDDLIEKQKYKVTDSFIDEFNAFLKPFFRGNDFYFPDASFPFESCLEEWILNEIKYSDEPCFGLYYEDLVNFKYEVKEFQLTLQPEKFYEKIELFHEKVKLCRVKHYFDENPKHSCEIPSIPDEELFDRWKEYFKDHLTAHFLHDYLSSEEKHLCDNYFGLEVLPEEVTATVRTLGGRYQGASLGDILQSNLLELSLCDVKFFLRKCMNGKYTISGINLEAANGSFYLKEVGNELKEKHGDFFDFNDPSLKAVFAYSPYRLGEYFFIPENFTSPLISKTTTNLVPFR